MIYEYACTCGHRFEQMAKVKDPIPPCPKCASAEVRKVISATGGFVLRGEGWYRDGYGSAKPAAKGETG